MKDSSVPLPQITDDHIALMDEIVEQHMFIGVPLRHLDRAQVKQLLEDCRTVVNEAKRQTEHI